MTFEFKLPDIGEGVHEGEIVRWLVKEGDTIQEDQPIIEIATDKVTAEIPSPVSGILKERRGAEGDVIQVGSVLAVLEEHQSRHTQDGHQVLQHHIHRQAEHLAVQEPAADVHHDRHREDGEQVFCFEPEEGDSGSQVPVYRCYIERHCFSLLSHSAGPMSYEKLSQAKQA